MFGELFDGGFEFVEADGLGEVVVEAGGAAAGDVFVGAVAGEGDGGDVLHGFLADDVHAGAIGEADIADEEIEALFVRQAEGGIDGGGVFDFVAAHFEE